jgi:hypothetical protein
MIDYEHAYCKATGKLAPVQAPRLTPLFQQIAAGTLLPPRGQQAVDLGLTAHSLNDPREDPPLYEYYQWVLAHYFAEQPPHELTAKLIGMAFTCANLFQTDLPQPLTINPWQVESLTTFPLATRRAIVVENNGIFIWLFKRHPTWPLINQAGNDFNPTYVQLLQELEQRGLQLTYLGDLDSRGIQMADYLFQQLQKTSIEQFTALQTPTQVATWLAVHGKSDLKRQRTRRLTVQQPVFQTEMDSVCLLHQFVEQEQLIADYERLMPAWLDES